jgi:hypothetical protein
MRPGTLLRNAALLILAALLAMPSQFAAAQEETKKKVRVVKKKADRDSDHAVWFDDDMEKEVKVIMDDGHRIVIVNGDTVEVDDCDPVCEDHHMMMRKFAGPKHRMLWRSDDGPGYWFGDFLDDDHTFVRPDLDFDLDIPHLEILGFGDPEIREMERKSRDLARKARDAEGAEKAELEAELEVVLEEIFDKKQERRQERIDELNERLDKR